MKNMFLCNLNVYFKHKAHICIEQGYENRAYYANHAFAEYDRYYYSYIMVLKVNSLLCFMRIKKTFRGKRMVDIIKQ